MALQKNQLIAIVAVVIAVVVIAAAAVLLMGNNGNGGGFDGKTIDIDHELTDTELIELKEAANKDSNYQLKIEGSGYTVIFNNAAVKNIGSAAKLTVNPVELSTLDETVANALGTNAKVYDIKFGTNTTFGSKGILTITMPYTLAAGEKADDLHVYYIDEDDNIEAASEVTYKDGKVTFQTSHLSNYAITSKTVSNDPIIEAAEKNVTARCLVYGNANNDDTLDSKDLEFLKYVVENKPIYSKSNFPYMDVNQDGKVDNNDVSYLQKILDRKEKTLLYYVNYQGDVNYVHYPNTGNIAVTVDYGMMMSQAFGIYDRVTHATDKVITNSSEGRYPGVKSFKSIGTYNKSDLSNITENIISSGCTLVMGYISDGLYENLTKSGLAIDQIQLTSSAQQNGTTHNVISEMLTASAILGCNDKGVEYVSYMDKMEKYIADATRGITAETFICAYDTTNDKTTYVDTTGAAGGQYGDVWTLSHLPMNDIMEPMGSGYYEVNMEDIIKKNPDIIIISMWDVATDATDPAEVQKIFKEKALYFKETNAYKNGRIFGVNYEIFGTCIGVSGLGLLASYIWPNLFDEDTGWELLQEAVNKFTLLDANVKNCGGLLPYKFPISECVRTLDNANLKVVGNVDGDNDIDVNDLKVLQAVIDFGGTVDRFPIADANQDGVIDSKDITYLESIINWQSGDERVKVYHINYHDTDKNGTMDTELVSTMYPVDTMIMTGSANSFMLAYMLGLQEKTVGASYGSTNDKTLYSDNFLNTSKVKKLGTSSTTIAFEDGKSSAASELIASEKSAGHNVIVLSDWNRTYLDNEASFEKANVDVVRVAAAGSEKGVYTHSISLLGFLFGNTERASALIDLYNESYNTLYANQASKGETAVASSMDGYVSCNGSDYNAPFEAAGIEFGLAGYPFGTATSVKTIDHLEIWNTDKYHFDYIFHIRTAVTYAGDIPDATIKSYSDAFDLWEYSNGENQYILSGSMPVPLRGLYVATTVSDLTVAQVDAIHQKFIDNFFEKKIVATNVDFIIDCSKSYKDSEEYIKEAVPQLTNAKTKIYGNINGDEYLTYADLDIITALIKKGASAADYPAADANQDGKIDNADKIVVNKIIGGSATDFYYIDNNGNTQKSALVLDLANASLKVYGNVNGDGVIDNVDLMILKNLKQTKVYTSGYKSANASNTSSSHAVNDSDISIVTKMIAGEKVTAAYLLSGKATAFEFQYVDLTKATLQVYGNVNGDSVLDSADTTMIAALAGANAQAYSSADANQDGKIDNADVELVNSLIGKQKTTLYYRNYFGDAQAVNYPVDTSSIGLTYWQQGEITTILGLWDNVTVASRAITDNKSNQYDCSKVTPVGTTGSSAKAVDDAGVETMIANNVKLIIATPSTTIRDTINEKLPDVTALYLWYAGDYCIPTITTLGVILNKEAEATKFVNYATGVTTHIQDVLSKSENKSPSILVTMLYEDEQSSYTSKGGVAVLAGANEGAYTMLQCLGNVYGLPADQLDAWGKAYKSKEWLIANDFDYIIDLEESTGFKTTSVEGAKFYTQDQYNARFEKNLEWFTDTAALKNCTVIGSTYVFGGFSGYGMLTMMAYMLYPSLFTLEEAQTSLQFWFDNFTDTTIDVTKEGGYYYTGSVYTPEYLKK